MSVLKNPRYERFAQGLAKGMTADAAYAAAGYKPDRANASHLTANHSVKARVGELLDRAAKKTVDALAFDATSILRRIQKHADAAAEAGDFKAALSGDIFIATCFGYKDSPTLTHEHVHGKGLSNTEAAPKSDEPAPHRFSRISATLHEFKKSL